MTQAGQWEQTLLDGLKVWGWSACAYGQGMLTPDVRDALRCIDTPIRWHPDIIAVRGDVAYFVDAKTGRKDTVNHSIEKSSLAAFHDWYVHTRLPVVICWESNDGSADCVFVWDLLANGALLVDMSFNGDGSGTPAWLWPKAHCRPARTIFGPEAQTFGPPPGWRMRQVRSKVGA
jgi:hypothetical protein